MDFITALSRMYNCNSKGELFSTFDQVHFEYKKLTDEIVNPLKIDKRFIENTRHNRYLTALQEKNKYPIVFSTGSAMNDGSDYENTGFNAFSKNVYTEAQVTSPYGIKDAEAQFEEDFKEFLDSITKNNSQVDMGGMRVIFISNKQSNMEPPTKNEMQFPVSYYGVNSLIPGDIETVMEISKDLGKYEPERGINTNHTWHLDHLNKMPNDDSFLSRLKLKQKKHSIVAGVKMNQVISTLKKTAYGSWDTKVPAMLDINGGTLHIAIASEKDTHGKPMRNSKYNRIEMFFDDKEHQLKNMDFSSLGEDFVFDDHFSKVDFGDDSAEIYDIISENAIFAIIAEFISIYRTNAFHFIESIVNNVVERSQNQSLLATPKNLRVATEVLMGSNSKIIHSDPNLTLAFTRNDLRQKDGSNVIILDITDITDVRKLHRRVMVLPGIEPIVIMAYENDNGKVVFGWMKLGRKVHEYRNGNPYKIVYDATTWEPDEYVDLSREDLVEFMSIGTDFEIVEKLKKFLPNPLSRSREDIERERMIQEEMKNHSRKDVYSMLFGDENGNEYEKIMAEVYRSIETLGEDFFEQFEENYSAEEVERIFSEMEEEMDKEFSEDPDDEDNNTDE